MPSLSSIKSQFRFSSLSFKPSLLTETLSVEGGWGWGDVRVVAYYAQSETEYGALLASFKSQQGSAVSTIYSRLWFEPPTAAARIEGEE